MKVQPNDTIVWCGDKQKYARSLVDILGWPSSLVHQAIKSRRQIACSLGPSYSNGFLNKSRARRHPRRSARTALPGNYGRTILRIVFRFSSVT